MQATGYGSGSGSGSGSESSSSELSSSSESEAGDAKSSPKSNAPAVTGGGKTTQRKSLPVRKSPSDALKALKAKAKAEANKGAKSAAAAKTLPSVSAPAGGVALASKPAAMAAMLQKQQLEHKKADESGSGSEGRSGSGSSSGGSSSEGSSESESDGENLAATGQQGEDGETRDSEESSSSDENAGEDSDASVPGVRKESGRKSTPARLVGGVKKKKSHQSEPKDEAVKFSTHRSKRLDLRGVELLFAADLDEEWEANEEYEPHYEKLRGIIEWVGKMTNRAQALMEGWKIHICRRTSGPASGRGSLESYFLTPVFKRLRTRKDVASFLRLASEEECSQVAAFHTALKTSGSQFLNSFEEDVANGRVMKEKQLAALGFSQNVLVGVERPLSAPLRIGKLVVVRLGHIVDLPKFTGKRFVVPLGFVSEVEFFNPRKPGYMTTFRNEVVLNEARDGPLFKVTDVRGGVSEIGRTPTHAWTLMIAKVLLKMHSYWENIQLGVKVSDDICAQNVLPNNTMRALGKTDDEEEKMRLIKEEVQRILQALVRKVEVNVTKELEEEARAQVEAARAQALRERTFASIAAERLAAKDVVPAEGVANVTLSADAESSSTAEAAAGSSATGPEPKKRRPIQMRDLVRVGKIKPGDPISIEYQDRRFHGTLTEEGQILYDNQFYDTPSAFSITMKRRVNPGKLADDGWKSCIWKGYALDSIKRTLTDEELDLIDAEREKEGQEHKVPARRISIDKDPAEEPSPYGKGIGEKNYLAGAPGIENLPQPHKIMWWQVDLTPMVNEQMGRMLFGLDQPIVMDLIEALPLLSENSFGYSFRMQRGTREKEVVNMKRRDEMLVQRMVKAEQRILKHQETVDRRAEAAARRHLRIEDRHSRNMRVAGKRADKEAKVQAAREDREARIRDKQTALDAIKQLKQEIRVFRAQAAEDADTSEEKIQALRKELDMQREVQEKLGAEKHRAEQSIKREESPESASADSRKDLQLFTERCERQSGIVAALEKRVDKLAKRAQELPEKHARERHSMEAKQELFTFYAALEAAGETVERYLSAGTLDHLPDDESLEQDRAINLEALRPASKPEWYQLSGTLLEIWDFLAKFGPDMGLCPEQPLGDGVFNPKSRRSFVTDEALDGEDEDEVDGAVINRDEGEGEDLDSGGDAAENSDEDSQGNEDDDDDDDDDAVGDSGDEDNNVDDLDEMDVDDEDGSSKMAQQEAPKAIGRPRTRVRPVLEEEEERTPVLLLPELERALETCDMDILGPVHVALLEFLFLGHTASDLSEAAKDRSLSSRRHAPVNESTWQEIVRFYVMFLVRQLQQGVSISSIKETLQDVNISVAAVMDRLVDSRVDEDEMDDENENNANEKEEELTGNARRIARRIFKNKLLAARDASLQLIVSRLEEVSKQTYSGSDSAELLLEFPTQEQINRKGVFVPPPGLARMHEAAAAAAAATAAATAAAAAKEARAAAKAKSAANASRKKSAAKKSDAKGTPAKRGGSGKAGGAPTKVISLVPPAIQKLTAAHIVEMPDWAQKLVEIRDLATNRGSRIRAVVQEAVKLLADVTERKKLHDDLKDCIKPGVFKSNAAGPCKRATLILLLDAIRPLLPEELRKLAEPQTAVAAPGGSDPVDSALEKGTSTPQMSTPIAARPNTQSKERGNDSSSETDKANPKKKKRSSKGATAPTTASTKVTAGKAAAAAAAAAAASTPASAAAPPATASSARTPAKKSAAPKQEPAKYPREESMSLRDNLPLLQRCRAVCRALSLENNAFIFCAPVDTSAFEDYLVYVPNPMDLSTIDKKLAAGAYPNLARFLQDLDMVWSNCKAYNQPGSDIAKLATRMTSACKLLLRAWVYEEPRVAKLNPFVYATELPEAPWGDGLDPIIDPHVPSSKRKLNEEPPATTTTTTSSSAEPEAKKHKKHIKANAETFHVPSELENKGFAAKGAHVGQRTARKLAGKPGDDDDDFERGTIVAFSNGLTKWLVKFDDDGELAQFGEQQLDESFACYADYTACKKRNKKEKKKKSNEEGNGKDAGGSDGESEFVDSTPTRMLAHQNGSSADSEIGSAAPKQETPEDNAPWLKVESRVHPLLQLDPNSAFLGGIVSRYFEDVGCIEGIVTSYSKDSKLHTIVFADAGVEMEVSEEEIKQMEREAALLRVGSDRNGVEDEAKEIARIEAVDPMQQRCYRRIPEERTTEDDEDDRPLGPLINGVEATGDPMAPEIVAKSKEIVLMRRLVVALGTQRYEDIDLELRTALLRLLCEQVAESGTLRDAIERRMLIMVRTRTRWKDLPPVIKKTSPDLVEDPDQDVLDFLSGEGVAEQKALERRLTQFKTKYSDTLSNELVRAIERVEKDLEKQKRKKTIKDDARRWKAELEFKLQVVSARPKHLGFDRHFNSYMVFPSDGSRIFVYVSEQAVKAGLAQSVGWRVVGGRNNINRLMSCLNPLGAREAALLHAIQSRSSLFTRGVKSDRMWKLHDACDHSEPSIMISNLKGAARLSMRFYKDSQAGIIVGDEALMRHVRAAEDASPETITKGSLSERSLVDVKVFLLNIEYAVLITRLDQPIELWMQGWRAGWIRLVTSATNWRDLRQACFILEYTLQEIACPVESYFSHLYGDCGYALRTKTCSSLAARICVLDSAINHQELSRQATARTAAALSRGAGKGKKRGRAGGSK